MNFKYVILPGVYLKNDYYLNMHNKIYSFWYFNWIKVFNSLSNKVEIKQSEFRRQSYIAALLNDSDDIIGTTLHTLFNINSIADCEHHYFRSNYSNQFIPELKKRNLSKVISIEYLTVSENYRKKEMGFSAAQYLVALAHRLQLLTCVEASISSCRKDFYIDKLEQQFGGEVLNPAGLHYGVETQNLITLSQALKEPTTLKHQIDIIWHNKILVETDQRASSSTKEWSENLL